MAHWCAASGPQDLLQEFGARRLTIAERKTLLGPVASGGRRTDNLLPQTVALKTELQNREEAKTVGEDRRGPGAVGRKTLEKAGISGQMGAQIWLLS